jgi:hypothetical protein
MVNEDNPSIDTDELCDCIDTYADCLGDCDGWCTADIGDLQAQIDAYKASYCNNIPCFSSWCDLITSCESEDGGDEDGDEGNTREYYQAILCYYVEGQDGCNFQTLLADITKYAKATIEFLDDQCDRYENYCEDIGAYDDDKRRGERRKASIKFTAEAFQDDQTAEESYNAVVQAVEDGNIAGATTVAQSGCADCGNRCKDCGIKGQWHRILDDRECDDFDDCPSAEAKTSTDLRVVLDFKGDSTIGDNEELKITQYWDFGLGRQCTSTWEATYRFYSDANQCSNRISIDGDSCNEDCDLLASDFKDMVCDKDNVRDFVPEGYHSTIFATGCGKVSIDGTEFRTGTGSSSAGVLLPSLFALVVMCVLSLLF